MARKGRRNNRKTRGAGTDAAGPAPPVLQETAPIGVLQVAAPAQTGPVLPIEVILLVAELLIDDGEEAWDALVAMTRVSRDFRTASLPVLVRDFDLEKNDGKFERLLKNPLQAIISHIRTARLSFDKDTRSAEHALLKKIAGNLRSLSVDIHSGPIGPNLAKTLNSSLSDKLESLDICYMSEMNDDFTPGRPAPSTMPERLQFPSKLAKLSVQLVAEGSRFENPMEEQVWRVVDSLPKLAEWSISLDPVSTNDTVLSLKDFPTSKISLLSEVSGPPWLLTQLIKLDGFAPLSLHVWDRRYSPPWKDFEGFDVFTNMPSITRLTLEKVRLDAPLFHYLPINLQQLYLLDFDTVGPIGTPFPKTLRPTVINSLSFLADFRLLSVEGFYRNPHCNDYYWEKRREELLNSQIAFWQTLDAPFAVKVKLVPHHNLYSYETLWTTGQIDF